MENDGPWGQSAPRDSRLPEEVKRHLRGHRAVKVLLARRHGTGPRTDRRGAPYQVMLCLPARRLLLGSTFQEPEDLLDLDLAAVLRGAPPDAWEQLEGPVFGVCTHGRHDACCAERGRPVCAALAAARPEQTWEVSHVGGDRFAPNMVVLPEGHYYGRLTPQSVVRVADLHAHGRVDLDHWRGRASYPMSAQYAEVALRRHLREDRYDACRLVAHEGPRHDFRHTTDEGGDATWRVTVTRTLEEEAQLTCSAGRASWVPVLSASDIHRI